MSDDCLSACKCCPRVDGCCFCCSLQTGSTFIGFILIIIGVLNITFSALSVGNGYYLTIFDLSIVILMTITGILLLFGIFLESPILVKISLILMLMLIFLYAIILILAIVELAIADKQTWHRGPLLFLLGAMLRLTMLIFFFIVVLSFYD